MEVETLNEWCPYCEEEQEIKVINRDYYQVFKCPNCGAALILCSICDHDSVVCTKCELSKQAEKLNHSK